MLVEVHIELEMHSIYFNKDSDLIFDYVEVNSARSIKSVNREMYFYMSKLYIWRKISAFRFIYVR